MDSKWLQGYERATLYGETLEIIDYSPEIDTNLKIICFPTFPGHCGCILFNADKMRYIKDGNNLVRWIIVSMKSDFANKECRFTALYDDSPQQKCYFSIT